MTKVSEQRMKLRVEYSRETDLIFSDNIPAYADWLEKKLALSQHDVRQSLPTDEHLKFAVWCISNGVTTYYNEDDGERYIDNDKEIFFDISQIYEKFKRQ